MPSGKWNRISAYCFLSGVDRSTGRWSRWGSLRGFVAGSGGEFFFQVNLVKDIYL